MKKISNEDFGITFLHTHILLEKNKKLDNDHAIVDKKDLINIIEFFRLNPDIVNKFNKFNKNKLIK